MRRYLPVTRRSVIHKVTIYDPTTGAVELYITAGEYEDGTVGEVFLKMGKLGSTMHGLLDTIGLQTSLLLQHGVPLSTIAGKLQGTCFPPSGQTDSEEVKECSSITDYMGKWLQARYGGKYEVPTCGITPDGDSSGGVRAGGRKARQGGVAGGKHTGGRHTGADV